MVIPADPQSLPLTTLLGKLSGYLGILPRSRMQKFMSDSAQILTISELQQYFFSFSFGGTGGKNKLVLGSSCSGTFACACAFVCGVSAWFLFVYFTDGEANSNDAPVPAGGRQGHRWWCSAKEFRGLQWEQSCETHHRSFRREQTGASSCEPSLPKAEPPEQGQRPPRRAQGLLGATRGSHTFPCGTWASGELPVGDLPQRHRGVPSISLSRVTT